MPSASMRSGPRCAASRHSSAEFPQIEACQRPAIGGEFPLALHYVNRDIGLAIDSGGEVLGGRGGNGRVALNDARNSAAQSSMPRERASRRAEAFFCGL